MEEFYQLGGMVICVHDKGISWIDWNTSSYPEDKYSVVCYTGRAYIKDDTLFVGGWKTMQQEKKSLSEIEKDVNELPKWNKTTFCDFGSGLKIRIKEAL